MAVAMDLGDPGALFIPEILKQNAGYRLALAGRAVAYNDDSLYYTRI